MAFRPQRLGPGAIYFRALDEIFRSNGDLIKVAEVEPQALWTKATTPGALPRGSPIELRALTTLPQRMLTHGVGYPLGGTICDQQRHVEEYRRWTEELGSPWTSEHLSVLDVDGADGARPCGFLMPPLQTDAGVELAARNIVGRGAALGRPLAFETGVNYFDRRAFEMPDGAFFAAIAKAANCGILLDLTNLWVNHKNGRARIGDVLAELPLERVWEMHLAGIEFAHGHWLDAHSGAIDPDLAALAREVVASLPNLGAIIFEIAPDRLAGFGAAAFLREMDGIHQLWEIARRPAAPLATAHRTRSNGATAPSPEAWEHVISRRLLPAGDRFADSNDGLNLGAADERSFALYAELIASFRRGAIAEMLPNAIRLLLIAIGEKALRDLLARYFAAAPPSTFATDEALGFRRFLGANPLPAPGLDDMLAFEASLVEAAADSRTIEVTIARDIEAMLADLAAGRLPGPFSDYPPTVLEIGVEPAPFVRRIEGPRLS